MAAKAIGPTWQAGPAASAPMTTSQTSSAPAHAAGSRKALEAPYISNTRPSPERRAEAAHEAARTMDAATEATA